MERQEGRLVLSRPSDKQRTMTKPIIERAARAGMSGAEAAECSRAMDVEMHRLQPHNLWRAMIDAALGEN